MKKLLILAFLLLLAACKPAQTSTETKAETKSDAALSAKGEFYATDISGAEFAKALSLTDHTGKQRSLWRCFLAIHIAQTYAQPPCLI
jgi:hypothetical protein